MDYSKPTECLAALDKINAMPLNDAHTLILRMLQALYEALAPVNQHLEVLEALRDPLDRIESELARHYAEQPLPPDSEENRLLKATTKAWSLMARSYAQVARRDVVQRELEGQQPLLAQRRTHYCGRVILEFFRAHRSVPAEHWLELHECFATAENNNWVRIRVNEPHNTTWRAQSTLEAYVAVMLVELANPYARADDELILIMQWAQRFAPYFDVMPTIDRGEKGVYAVVLDEGKAIRPAAHIAPTASVRGFDGKRLGAQIRSAFDQIKAGVSPATLNLGEHLGREKAARLLVSLYRPWGLAACGRRHQRRATRGELAMASDWLAIGFLVSGRVFEQPRFGDNTRSLRQDLTTLTFGERVEEVKPPEVSIDERAEMLGFSQSRWNVLDQSVSGFRIGVNEQFERLEYQQLIAIRPPDSLHFLLAHISWLMFREDGALEAGVHLLAGLPNMIGARVHLLQPGNRTPFSQAFMLPEVKALGVSPTVILPAGWFKSERIIEIYRDGRREQIRLIKPLILGANFVQCTFEYSASEAASASRN